MITAHWCPVEPTGMHRWLEEALVVYTLHPRCKHCGFINTEIDLTKVREEERGARETL